MNLEFSIGVRLTHFFNFLLLSLLVRSGIEILGAHPKLSWRDHCSPGSAWIPYGQNIRTHCSPTGYTFAALHASP
jgi:hypothetical protein